MSLKNYLFTSEGQKIWAQAAAGNPQNLIQSCKANGP